MARFTPYHSPGAFIEPTEETLRAIEASITWAEVEVPSQLRTVMHRFAQTAAIYHQGEARRLSFGPFDPSQINTSAAWKIPVRRITNRYYLGWKVRSRGIAVWQSYNDSREAYFIEYGINWLGGARRVRRPIGKLAYRRTIRFLRSSAVSGRVFADIFEYKGPKTLGFYQKIQSPPMGSFGGPLLGRRLP